MRLINQSVALHSLQTFYTEKIQIFIMENKKGGYKTQKEQR